MREVKLMLKDIFMSALAGILLTVVSIVAVAIFAAITVGVVMSGMWTASLFK